MTHESAPDVVVVGGGAVGCSSALELRKRGASVLLIERDSVASHASGFAYGGLYATTGAGIPGPVLPVARECVERHREISLEIREATGLDTGFRPAASIEVAFDEKRMNSLRFDADWQAREGFAVELLEGDAVRELEPDVSADVIGGALHTSHFEVDSYQYTFGLGWAFEKLGGEIRQANVDGLSIDGGRVTGITLGDGSKVATGSVVLATGPWAGTAQIAGAGALPVRPVKGEILRLEYPGPNFGHRVVLDSHYIARKPDGMVWAGTTDEEIGSFDDAPSDPARASIMEGVLRLSPALESARLARHTACLRPVSSDGLPIVGPSASADGLFVANGAGKKGILLSPAISRWVAGLVIDRDNAAVPPPFRSERFESNP